MIEISELKCQINITIKCLEQKQLSSNEWIVDSFLSKYRTVQAVIDSNESKDEIIKVARMLLGECRHYLETSSNYNQAFFYEMSNTEGMIKLM